MKRRIIAALMALCLCIGLLPATALAVDGPEIAGDDAYTGIGTIRFTISLQEMYKLLLLNAEETHDSEELPEITGIAMELREKHYVVGYELAFSPIGELGNETDYFYALESNADGKLEPDNFEKLIISYRLNGETKSAEIPADELRLVYDNYPASAECAIESRNDGQHIVLFFKNYTVPGASGNFLLHAVRLAEDGKSVSTMPPVPTHTTGTFSNWSTEKIEGENFNAHSPVHEDMSVYEQFTTSEHSGTEIRVMNEQEALLNRYVELYNASHEEKISSDQIHLDTVKITVNGVNEDGVEYSTDPDYSDGVLVQNGWKDENSYYYVNNYVSELGGGLHNTHMAMEDIRSITVSAVIGDDQDPTSITIEQGDTSGNFSITLGSLVGGVGSDAVWEFTINAPTTPPTDEDLTGDPDDPDDPNDTGLLGDGAVTVDCTSETADHADKTYGLKDGYTIGKVEWRGTGDAAAYYVDITNIAPDAYVTAYNTTIKDGHALSPADQGAKTITLKWVDSSWTVASVVPVTFTVTCDDEVGDGYTLTYNYNQGGGSTTSDTANRTYAANESANLPKTISVDIDTGDDGVVFVGWTEKPNNYTKSTPATVEPTGMVASVTFSNENITVYAVWAQDANNDDIPDYEDEDFAMQDVYVYAKPIGSGTDGALTEAEEEILKETYGLTLNAKGYCVLGKLENVLLPLASQQDIGQNYYSNYDDVIQAAFAADKFTLHESAADHQDLIKTLDWYHLGVASGADGYENEAPSSGLCWHLDGNLNISAKYKLTYDANGGTFNGEDTFVVNNIALADAKSYTLGQEENPAYADPEHDAANGKTVLFAGWTTDGSAQDQIYSVKDAKNGSVPAAVEAVDLTENDTVYALWSYDADDDGTPDINEIIVTPADITIYTGGDSYTGEIVDSKGDPVTSGGEDETQDYNGFPEPGFYITLPTALNDQLRGGITGPVNLSEKLSFVYENEATQEGRQWTLKMYNPESPSNIAFSKYVYRMTPAEGQEPVRLQIVGEDGPISNDRLEDFGTDNLFETYTMSIYGGGVETDAVKARLTINGVTQSCDIYVDSGVLTVRGTTKSADTVAINDSTNDANGFQATAADSNNYYINGSNIEVAAQDVHLLTDELTGGQEQLNQLQEKAEDALNTAGITETDGLTYDFMYLDLVDSSNGNAYVTLNKGGEADGEADTVTIHWPIPDDADPDGKFYVVHFDGLNRNYTITDGNIPIDDEKIDVYHSGDEDQKLNVNTDVGSVSFETSTFSPFALVYEKTSTPTEQVTVTFKISHGTWSDGTDSDRTVTITKGTALPAAQIPTGMRPNSGYTGGSWDTTPTTTTPLNSNVTYTYSFTRSGGGSESKPYLRFDSNGGTEFDPIDENGRDFSINVYHDEKYGDHIPTRPGYRFTGWYNTNTLRTRIDEDEILRVTSYRTVFAGWEETSVPSMLNGDDHYAYIQGYSDGTVRPNANITRAQVATIFFRLLDEDVRDDNLTTYNTFPDVDEDYWANTAISTMASLGVINGRNSGLFDPDAYITRAEFAAICARFDDSGVDGITTFTDTVGHWAEDEISRAAALGWIQGYSDGTFRPNQYITRAQAVTMINRVLCRLPEDTDDLLSGMNTWTDCHEDDWFYLAIQEATNSHDFVAKDRVYESWTDLNRAPDWSRYE